jgi:hypothetical protein
MPTWEGFSLIVIVLPWIENVACPRSARNSHAVMKKPKSREPKTSLPSTDTERLVTLLKGVRMRHEHRPAWFNTDDGNWWVTDFTYGQMEGNRKATLEQIDRLIDAAMSADPAKD